MFAKFLPDGTRVAFVRANNIHVERLADDVVTPMLQRPPAIGTPRPQCDDYSTGREWS